MHEIYHYHDQVKRIVHNLAQTFIAVMLSAVPVSSAAGAIDQFAAKTIGDHGNVTVMEVTGTYDEKTPDGTVNAGPRQIISKEFYRLHKDEYDFLVIFSNFNFRLSDGTIAFYLGARNDTRGIGNELFDSSLLFGSSRLQGTIDMGNIANLSMVPTDPKFQFTLDTISHEMMHRWAAYARFRNPDGSLNTGLLGKDGSHWSFLLSTDASLMYGNTWQDNGNGTFTSVRARKYYSPLDLYLMGFIDKSQVPPMLLIDNPDIDPKRVSQVGVTISGTPRYITIDDIIAAEGERVPGPAEAQKTFKTAFIFITEQGTFTGDEIYGLENVRNGWLTRYSVLTDGAGLVQVALSPLDNLPVNPGVIPPTVTPRTLPPNIDDAVTWIKNEQKSDGSWMDLGQTAERDTAEAVVALKEFVAAGPNYSTGLQWLGGQSSGSTDYLARTAEALADAGLDTASQMSEIASRQNRDGGWGSGKSFASSPSDTGLVLKMLAKTGYTGQPVIAKAIEYLKAKQNPDGGWGNEEGSRVETTANVLFAFRKYTATYALDDRIASGSSWLLQHQNPDGGFGNSPSTVYDTARALLTLAELDIAKDSRNRAIGYILQGQSGDGSWRDSPYQTALAIEALYKATVDPDLAVKASDLSFSPATIASLPSNVVLSANIANLGRTAVPQAKVALYENISGSMAKLAEQTVSFPGRSTVTVYFPILFDDESSRTFYIMVDPDNLVAESDKANNTASRNLQAEAGIMPDLAITPSSISFVPQTIAAIPSTLAINVDVANLGSSTVPQAKVALYDGDVSEANKIAEQIAAFPGRGNTTISFPVAITDGRERVFTVAVDPGNLIKESDKTNNMAVQRIKPVAFTEPDLSISSNDITFAPSTIGAIPSTVTINARIANFGKTAAQSFKVALYEGVVSDASRIGETTASVQGEDFVVVSFSTTVNDASDHKYIVSVDPDNQVPESVETNNTAWNVLKNSLVYDFEVLQGNLSALPNPVDLGQDVTISAKISNKGRQNAYSVHVRYYLDLPGAPLDIATTTVDIPAGGSVSDQVTWKTSRPGPDLPVTVHVDPLSEFIEVTKANNKAAILLTVNGPTDPNLTVSYKDIVITPNPAQERGNANILVLVKNEGFSAASNVLVNFYEGVPGVDGVPLGSQTIPLLNAGDSARASIDWVGIKDVGKKIIYVKVDPDNAISETSKDDNTAFLTLQILTLPDLAISTNSIVFNPVAPKDGDPVSINVTIKNLGEQSASNVLVKAYEGSTVIGSQTISGITGNSQAATSFSYDTNGKNGPHQITVIVDPDNTIVERIKENNTASRTFGIRDAKLWVTEQYISPNGDGIKDSTQVFFGLDASQTVRVLIVNEKGETVRTFSGTDLENATGGNVVWNGLNDNGSVAADGQYHIRVTDMNGNILGSLLVTLDNNRSPLSRALGTKYLLNSNLTCKLPDFSEWKWLPSESGMIFSINYADADADASGYPPGLYSMAPDGEDVIRLVPDNTVPYEWAIEAFDLSPDGEKIAFIANDRLWVVNSDGKQLTMLDEPSSGIYDVRWSPDRKHLLYTVGQIRNQQGYSAYELWIVNAETKATTKIDWGFLTFGLGAAEWSPDGQHITYLALSDSMLQQYRQVDELKLSDLAGNKSVIHTFDRTTSYTQMYWLDRAKIAFQHPSQSNQLWAYDLTGGGHHLFISEYPDQVVQNPDKGGITYRERLNDRKIYVRTVNAEGSISTHYEASDLQVNSGSGSTGNLSNLIWSFDGRKIAFADMTYKKIDKCIYEPALIALDAPSMKRNGLKIFNSEVAYAQEGYPYNSDCADPSKYALNNVESIASWLPDNENLLLLDNKGYFDFNTTTGEKGGYIPIDGVEAVSPAGRYINYYRDADPAGICYGRGWPDVWAIGSMLNLTADLRINKERSLIRLKGIAADLNFEGYRLEYSDAKTPDNWNLVGPPSDMPVLNDLFTTWVPPHEGAFFLKLTVWDKAGNIAIDRKRVSWGLSAAITNLYKTREIFSPNGDGLKDTVELHYTVLEPVHLDFFIYAEDNSIVRTLNRDHTSHMDDFITWDGRDESGRIVPDGKYTIKLFDYEFFVEVDNTPPDANLMLTPVVLAKDDAGYPAVSSELRGHAVDRNLKKWAVEYGEGLNPSQWVSYGWGVFQLTDTDPLGNPLLNPPTDVLLEGYVNNGLEFLVGKKFRVVAEDAAGNQQTAVTDMIDERLFFNDWDGTSIIDEVPAHLLHPGRHMLGGLETIQNPVHALYVQYSQEYDLKKGGWINWIDSEPKLDPASGNLFIEWDNSLIDFKRLYAIRLKAIDDKGVVFYSNIMPGKERYGLQVGCSSNIDKGVLVLEGNISLYQPFKQLRFQAKSQDDSHFAQWTDIELLYGEAGGALFGIKVLPDHGVEIPQGQFVVGADSVVGIVMNQFSPHMRYTFRMVGTFEDGTEKETIEAPYPPKCDAVVLGISVSYKDADECQMISGKASIGATASYSSAVVSPISLKLYLNDVLVANPLENLDTISMPEGTHPIRAEFEYIDLSDGEVRMAKAQDRLIVDRALPAAEITYPTKPLRICPVKVPDVKGDWFGLPVEGIASDNMAMKRYELSYGIGEKPSVWIPATTQVKGKKVPITGDRPVAGRLGIWDITDLKDTDYSLKLKVLDVAGNAGCYTTNFVVDTLIEVTGLNSDRHIVSPNGDGTMDDVTASYQIDEYATVAVKVFKASTHADGSYVLDSTPVRTIASGIQHLGGAGTIVWDGMGDSGSALPDGSYGIAVIPTDTCGNTNMKWVLVEVDNTPPTMVITYPRSTDPIGNVVEIRGTANDPHFLSYSLEVGEGDIPIAWLPISSEASPVNYGILGIWNTFGLQGRWTLKLSGADTVGNKNETSVSIDLGTRQDLIKNLNVLPKLFSPNNDNRLDTTNFNYNLTGAHSTKIEIIDSSGTVRKTYATTAPSAGAYMYLWDGRDSAGILVPDGAYIIKLTAALSSNPSVTQTETVTVVVDTTLPLIDIKQPIINSYIKSNAVTVFGTTSDVNLAEYSITNTGETGTAPVDAASQSRGDYVFGTLNDLPEGTYAMNVKAKDLAENSSEKNIPFTIDRTPPKVTLDAPKDREFYGNIKNVINATGGIVERNLEGYSLRCGLGDNPTLWTVLQSGNAVPVNPQLFSWKVGKNDAVPDGLYTLSLYAKDKAGWEREAKVKVTIDNTPPDVSIASPRNGDYAKAATDIRGTAFDANLLKYILEISAGPCGSAFKWAPLKIATNSVKDGSLGSLQALPPDGNYCLRLTALDKVENSSMVMTSVKIDTTPPASPVLSGKVENKKDARLTWTASTESDLAGYDLYRDGQKINSTLLKDALYLDQSLKENVYAYVVKAIDLAGNESKPSNEIKLKIDLTGPDAAIRSPQDGARIGGIIDIKGTAYSIDDFKEYRVFIGVGEAPSSWMLSRTSPLSTSYGILAQWDTLGLPENAVYSIKLETEDLSGNINTDQIKVVIDNLPPAPPVLVTAVPNGSDVTLTWNANTDTDLSGYLLYRNEQLANVAGIVVGNLKPYLMTATAYPDKALPDGKYKYYLIAMDRAGNMSGQSNVLEVTIDTHPPHTIITEPRDKAKFDRKTMLKAESPDNDIATVKFLYKKAVDTTWTNLGDPITKQPFVTFIDPAALALSYADYQIMSVSTDMAGNGDPSPAFITLTYTDVTPPATVQNLKAATNGQDVALTWTADTAADLEGYSIYRISGGSRTKLNAAKTKEISYHDRGLSDATYTYEVTASDLAGNESKASNQAMARVYAPVITQPYTPSDKSVIQLQFENATPGSSVDLFNDSGSGPVSLGTTQAGTAGTLTLNLSLSSGENRLTAKATDQSGNISRGSDMVMVAYSMPPAAPTGLVASAQGHDVALTWNANVETDIAGYNLFRNGEKLNAPAAVAALTGSASSSYSISPAENALDGQWWTYWRSDYGSVPFNPVWYEIDLASRELINSLSIQWLTTNVGKDYEIQAWSGYAWIPIHKMTGNTVTTNHIDIKPSYRTDKLRIHITDTTDKEYYKRVDISEITLFRDVQLIQPTYNDLAIHDGAYSYAVTAVNYYGFESPLSAEAMAEIGDVTPPAIPLNLSATVSGTDISLNWTANTEADLAGYNLYRFSPQGWTRLNTGPILDTTYIETGLPNGTYRYRLAAVDTVGNESLPSNEATAVISVTDTIVPPKPALFYPTVAGLPIVLQKGKTDVIGFAGAGSTVTLSRSGVPVGTTTASASDNISSVSIESAWSYASPSPDGKTLVNVDSYSSIWVKDLATGQIRQVTPYGYAPGWSPDGSKLSYEYYEDRNGFGNFFIGVYDLATGVATTLVNETSEPFVDEFAVSWSSDASRIAFVRYEGGSYNAWVKDFISGALNQVTSGPEPYYPKLAPNGNKLAYIDSATGILYEKDLSTGEIILVAENQDDDNVKWSLDSKKLLFIENDGQRTDLYRYDVTTRNKARLTVTDTTELFASWSPDGTSIIFGQNESDGSISVRMMSADVQDSGRALRQNMPGLNSLSWLNSGDIFFMDGQVLTILRPKGYFNFKDIPLDAGENLFNVVATDSSGNLSQPSDEISVILETSQLPDLETTTDDIYLYPAVPLAGQTLAINVVVWNRGLLAAMDVQADLYVTDFQGNMSLLKSVVIPSIDPESAEIVGANWDTTGKTGAALVTVVLDPLGKISEVTKSNNYAVLDFVMVDTEGIQMTTSLNSDQMQAKKDLRADIYIVNSGIRKTGNLEVSVEDERGYLVSVLYSGGIDLPYGYQRHLDLTWNSGSTFAGPYRVHSLLKDTSGVLAENVVSFTIMPDIAVKSSIVTDKAQYGPGENVSLSYTVENSGSNYIVPDMKATVRILDPLNKEMFREEKDIVNTLPGAASNFNAIWNAGLNVPGTYTTVIDVSMNGNVVSTNSAKFSISAKAEITGGIKTTPAAVIYGNQVVIDYSVTNAGNSDRTGILLRVLVMDPATQAIVNSSDETIDLVMKGTLSRQTVLLTQGLGLKTYVVVLQDVSPSITKTLANTSFAVIDGVPPTIGINSPASGAYFNAQIDLTAVAADDISGIDKVWWQIDGRGWKLLPVADTQSGRYSAAWTPIKADEGPHTVSFRAVDRSGNQSAAVSASFTIDLTPPDLAISTLSDGANTNNSVLNIAGTVTDNYGVRELFVNDIAVQNNSDGTFSYPIILNDGPNTINVTARDLAGNETQDARTINLDLTAPVITILTPADNIKTKQNPMDLSGMVDEQSTVTVRINGADPVPAVLDGNNFSLSIILVYGLNTIEVTATDLSGNTSSAKRTLTFDDRTPELAVTDPAQDVKTNTPDMTVKGDVSDISTVAVTITMDGNTYSPGMAGAGFELPIRFTTEKLYQIYVKATDELGNETIVQRNVIYDATAPMVTLDTVTSPTSMVSQIVTGTVEAGAFVSIACPTANVGIVSYPTPETWSAILSNMSEGIHVIEVAATDDVGNTSQTVRGEIVVDLTPPSVTIAAPVSGTTHNGKVDLIAIVSDSGSGVERVEYQIDSGDWKPLPVSDAAQNKYSTVWVTVLADEGTHTINFRAADRLGIMSSPISTTITIEVLSGTIKATPDPVSSGQEETLSYNITNATSGDIPGLTARILILDPDTGVTKQTYDQVLSIPANTAFAGSVKAPTKDLTPKRYNVVLQVAGAGLPLPNKELSRTTFEVKAAQNPGIEIEKTMPDVRNVLVWINDECQSETGTRYPSGYFGSNTEDVGCLENKRDRLWLNDSNSQEGDSGDNEDSSGADNDCRTCTRRDLVDRVLSESATSHAIVYSAQDFQYEIRNPYYTDILILGNQYPLEDHSWEELREKVNMGVGLISSLWIKQAADEKNAPENTMLGCRYKGTVPGRDHEILTVPSPVTGAGRIYSKGIAEKIEAPKGAVVAGWLEDGACDDGSRYDYRINWHTENGPKPSCESPAIVLSGYGKGRTVFHAFDIGKTLNDNTYSQVAALIQNSLSYVHSVSDSSTFGPRSLVPIEIRIRSLGSAFDLKVSESYPAGIKIYDPTTGAWITANPWINRLKLGAGETAAVLYYALMPDSGGTYTLKTDISYLENGAYIPLRSISRDLVAKDLKAALSDVLRALDELDARDSSEVISAKRMLQLMLRRGSKTRQAMETNIRSILAAIDSVIKVDSDTSSVRAMLDEILKGLESRYYFAY
ncbi:MAG: hypothetical protein EPN25_05690 [Nitrospirae bacterium]|nr:MAG: hypothetical protein EPN25_05690 [Nitrospirota bacterium]